MNQNINGQDAVVPSFFVSEAARLAQEQFRVAERPTSLSASYSKFLRMKRRAG
jgi:hypothetical protein